MTEILPLIRRAREYHVYSERRRYLDLWQDGGRAILGHRTRAQTELKRQLEKGATAAYPTKLARQFISALHRLIPGFRSFRWYTDPAKAREAVMAHLCVETPPPFVDPVVEKGQGGSQNEAARQCMVWRPYAGVGYEAARIIAPIIPVPGTDWLSILAFRDELDPEHLQPDLVSPPILAALKRASFDLANEDHGGEGSMWSGFDSRIFERHGPYLRYRHGEGAFEDLYRDALESGIILAPDVKIPSILPARCAPGEVELVLKIVSRHGG